ncbi:MAG: DUF1707 domain-containing protein [Nocardioidaceae bacterium]|nr:DUF1707 domain-containing protein [Nocardioidaceae bacterium]
MTDHDRTALSARIRRAAEQGRISEADRDIRLRNVASARSEVELDLIARDLDVLEGTLSPGSAVPPPVLQPGPVSVGPQPRRGPFRPGLLVGIAIGVLMIVTAAVVGTVAIRGGDSGSTLFAPEPIASAETPEPSGEPTDSGPASSYGLDGPGIRGFLAGYQRTFDTSLVVNLVLYDDYAVAQVPQLHKNRHAQVLFRPEEGWQQFGDISANFPGSRTVDLRRLDVAALVKNIARARRTLRVEEPTQTYVIVQHIGAATTVPSVDIHVGNEFNESGYLATRLDGTVVRAYPYQAR